MGRKCLNPLSQWGLEWAESGLEKEIPLLSPLFSGEPVGEGGATSAACSDRFIPSFG